MKTRALVILALALAALWAAAARAQEQAAPAQATPTAPAVPGVDEIVQKANDVAYYQGGTGRARVKLTIMDNKGHVRGEREMVILRRNGEGLEQKFYAFIERPADVRGTVFLVWKHTGKDDDRWLYSPGLDLVNRIAAGDKRTSFVGSHYYYEDVSGRSIDADEHELVQTTDNYYVLKNTPKDPDVVEFSYYLMYIDRATFMPLYVYYYDKNGQKYREFQVLGRKLVDDKYWTATKAQMIDLRDRSDEGVATTIAEYSDIRFGNDLPDDIFTERYLRRPPREYLQ